jgi:hypothetical protein
VILDRPSLTPSDLLAATGWEIKPEGACKEDVCVPLTGIETQADGTLDVSAFADRMGMPVAHDDQHRLWALGPRAGGRVLATETAPNLVLDDFDGHPFPFESLRGRKVLLVAWASW